MSVVRDQHMVALETANERRYAIKAVKKDLHARAPKESVMRCAELLRAPDDAVGAMRVQTLIAACRRVGETKVRRVLRANGINGQVRVRDITKRRRRVLAAQVEQLVYREPGR